ncbi:hypothetical protein ALC57_11761 [Trachymyrmex cornetzi]|uniref:THAP-type domain-containing protein n=1 Tax=Trachymyrmex cornetzi TaxID=471704 RepID=A0A151J1Z0_9HYME|nr:hypothetical protein ALC57_11761 [Trachymyrmex cornetzi]
MPGCCAKNCKNRSKHGFRMFLFLRDEKRRHLWAEKCGKNPTQNSGLCEVCKYVIGFFIIIRIY